MITIVFSVFLAVFMCLSAFEFAIA